MAGVFPNEKISFIYPPGNQHIPPNGKGTSSSKSAGGEGKMLVPQEGKSSPKKEVGSTFLHHPEIFFNHAATIFATQKQEEVASTQKKVAKKSFAPPLNIYIYIYIFFFSWWQPVAFTLRPIAQLNSKVGKNGELRSPAPAPKTQVVIEVRNLARKSCHTLHKGGVHIDLGRQSQQHVRNPMATWTPPQRKHQPAHDSGPAGTLWVWQFENCLGNPYQYSQKLEASSRADGYVDGAEYCGDWHKGGPLVLKIPNQTGPERSHSGRLQAALQWLPQPPAAKWWPLSGHWDQQDAPIRLVPHTGWPW